MQRIVAEREETTSIQTKGNHFMKIIHLSDLHVGKGPVREENLRLIVQDIVEKYKNSNSRPLIVVTGDVVDDGTRVQFRLARKILKPLHDAEFELFMVPGNHDYGRNGIHAKAGNIKIYKEEMGQPVNFPTEYPYGDCLFLGLDSMAAEQGIIDGNGAEGELGQEQLRELSALIKLRKDEHPHLKIIVCLHHHPFYYNLFLRLKDADDLKEVVAGSVHGILFGHKHKAGRFHEKQNKYTIPIIFASGSSTETLSDEGAGRAICRYFLIDTDASNGIGIGTIEEKRVVAAKPEPLRL